MKAAAGKHSFLLVAVVGSRILHAGCAGDCQGSPLSTIGSARHIAAAAAAAAAHLAGDASLSLLSLSVLFVLREMHLSMKSAAVHVIRGKTHTASPTQLAAVTVATSSVKETVP